MRATLVGLVVLMGCGPAVLPGAPQLGSRCMGSDTTASRKCYTEQSIAFCNAGTWDEYACETKCTESQTPLCALKKPVVGDACPAAWEGSGSCVSDTQLATCTAGKWVGRVCGTCSNASGAVTCS